MQVRVVYRGVRFTSLIGGNLVNDLVGLGVTLWGYMYLSSSSIGGRVILTLV